VDPLALLVLAGAGLGAWWLHRYQRSPARLRLRGGGRYETDAEVALHVAFHEGRSRGHEWLSSLHILYGLLQDEAVAEAIQRTGGDSAALEDRVLAALAAHEVTTDTAREAGWILAYAAAASEDAGRGVSCVDLWAALSRPPSEAAALVDATGSCCSTAPSPRSRTGSPATSTSCCATITTRPASSCATCSSACSRCRPPRRPPGC
jgi:hypothetical protein